MLALLDGADFTRAELYETFFTAVDLSNVIGLDTGNHRRPSFIDHHTFGESVVVPLRFSARTTSQPAARKAVSRFSRSSIPPEFLFCRFLDRALRPYAVKTVCVESLFICH